MTLENELNLAKRAALLAGDWLRRRSLEATTILKSEGKDIKMQADVQAEVIILELLQAESQFPILCEESGVHGTIVPDSPVWIVDPLDGTMNFSREIPFCCVSLALWKGDEPLLGVVYAFNQEELYCGLVGTGAWCNDKPISVSSVRVPSQAILATGFPVQFDFQADSVQDFLQAVAGFKKTRMLGSAALSLAYVANGRVDCYWEENIQFWDVAGGLALVVAAGGWIFMKPTSQSFWTRQVFGASDQGLVTKIL